MPATKVLANVYQLYMVEYQCASMLISHNQGMVDITVKRKPYDENAPPKPYFSRYISCPASTFHRAFISFK